jgi:hypothetical protein
VRGVDERVEEAGEREEHLAVVRPHQHESDDAHRPLAGFADVAATRDQRAHERRLLREQPESGLLLAGGEQTQVVEESLEHLDLLLMARGWRERRRGELV